MRKKFYTTNIIILFLIVNIVIIANFNHLPEVKAEMVITEKWSYAVGAGIYSNPQVSDLEDDGEL